FLPRFSGGGGAQHRRGRLVPAPIAPSAAARHLPRSALLRGGGKRPLCIHCILCVKPLGGDMKEPLIVIAGTQWRVPLLAPRQNRIVVPALLALGAQPQARYDLLLDLVFAALTRAHPQLARDDF